MVNSFFPFALYNGITFAIFVLFGNIPDVSDIIHIAEWLNYVIGVNMSERKSGTERTKKRKKRELVFFSPPVGANGTVVCLHRLDVTRILPEL